MTRATNPDGTPWWVSTGPPQPTQPPQPAQPAVAEPAPERPAAEAASNSSAAPSFFGVTPEAQAAALNAGLNLITAVLEVVSKPLTGEPEQTSTHDPSACGVCPLCVGLEALREHDAELADLVESAMAGVTTSIEKLTGLLPDLAEKAADTLTSTLVKVAFKNMTGK